ncbi:MAG: hypothetical protein JWM47_385 [Acidimicrobiales bacterium]|nr:hypothetical protein [Acidimicrobiales bacterium]
MEDAADAQAIEDAAAWLAGGEDPGGADDAVEPAWRERAEVLAVLLVVAAVGLMGQYLFTGLSFGEAVGEDPTGTASRWSVLLPILAQGGSPVTAGLVALALALVVFTPGSTGRWGRLALSAISVVGVLVATLAVLGIEEALRDSASAYSYQGGGPDGRARLYVRLAAVCLWLPSFAIGGYSAFTAWRALDEPGPPAGARLDRDQETEVELEPDDRL